jgi:ABC-type polar amino acid transport system ATPase subunit
MSLVKITGLSKKFRDNVVLDSIDLDVKKGDVIAVIGPSGTGKSTLLRCIDMLEKPDKGLIEFGDFVLMSPAEIKKILWLFASGSAWFFRPLIFLSRKQSWKM